MWMLIYFIYFIYFISDIISRNNINKNEIIYYLYKKLYKLYL